MPDEFTLPDEELAELMAGTVHCTLGPGRSASSDELQTASQAFIQYLNRDMAIAQEQFQQELKS